MQHALERILILIGGGTNGLIQAGPWLESHSHPQRRPAASGIQKEGFMAQLFSNTPSHSLCQRRNTHAALGTHNTNQTAIGSTQLLDQALGNNFTQGFQRYRTDEIICYPHSRQTAVEVYVVNRANNDGTGAFAAEGGKPFQSFGKFFV